MAKLEGRLLVWDSSSKRSLTAIAGVLVLLQCLQIVQAAPRVRGAACPLPLRGGGDTTPASSLSPSQGHLLTDHGAFCRDQQEHFRSFNFQTEPSHGLPDAPCPGNSNKVDADGDSLMGTPVGGASADEFDAARKHPVEQSQNMEREKDPAIISNASLPWRRRTPIPFKYVSHKIAAVAAQNEDAAVATLSSLITLTWKHSPDDLAPLLCLLRDQIMSPTLEGIELLPQSQLHKVIADAFGRTAEGLQTAVASLHGDLALAAQDLRASQRTLFPPPQLTLRSVVQSLQDLAPARGRKEGKDLAARVNSAKSLLVAVGSEETRVLVKALEGCLRFLGFSKHVVIAALAHAGATLTPSRHILQQHAQGSDVRHREHREVAAEVQSILWRAVSAVPDWRKLTSVLLSRGVSGLLSALGCSSTRVYGVARAAKLKALQRVELAEVPWGEIRAATEASKKQQEHAEGQTQVAREQRAAALASGLSAQQLSSAEERSLCYLLQTKGNEKRLVRMRNEMLRRQRRRVEDGGLDGPWFLSKEEAIAGLECDDRPGEPAAVYDVLELLGLLNPVQDLLQPMGTRGEEAWCKESAAWSDEAAASVHGDKASKRVVVVGGGFAGVTAARRLRGWGYQVQLLEAQNRSGGRTWSESMQGVGDGRPDTVDLGGMVVTGTQGNPLITLARHYGVQLRALGETCHLYGADGARVDATVDAGAEELFNLLLDKVAENVGPGAQGGDRRSHSSSTKPSAEVHTSDQSDRHPFITPASNPVPECRSLADHIWKALRSFKDTVESKAPPAILGDDNGVGVPRNSDPRDSNGDVGGEDASFEPAIRFRNGKGQKTANGAWRGGRRERDLLDLGVVIAKDRGPDHTVGSREWTVEEIEEAEGLLQWHCANLEFALGAPLGSVNAAWWNFDDASAYAGPHWMLPDGFASLLQPLEQDVPMRLNAPVSRIEYATDGSASVWYRQAGVEERVECDAVVVAVPLGVLKASVGTSEQNTGNRMGRIAFVPALPAAKRDAIERFGFGLLNKVVLRFSRRFWAAEEGSTDYFGIVQPVATDARKEEERGAGRGAGFMFWPIGGQDADTEGGSLLALMAGKAAAEVEEQSDEEVVEAAVRALRQVWGPEVGQPESTMVTRWFKDPYSQGAYSYIPVGGASPLDIEELSQPVFSKLFFAGEHTSSSHPAQVCGALLSGLRAAGEVHNAMRERASAANP